MSPLPLSQLSRAATNLPVSREGWGSDPDVFGGAVDAGGVFDLGGFEVVHGVEFGEVVEGEVAKAGGFGVGLVDDDGETDHFGSAFFDKAAEFGEFLAGAEDVVHEEDFFAGLGFLVGAETLRAAVFAGFGPIDLFGAEGFTEAKGDGESSGGGGDDGELVEDGAEVGVSTEFAAQGDTEGFGVLEVAHDEGDLEVEVGVESVGVDEVAAAECTGLFEEVEDFGFSGDEFHG
jgi:hypothetical protein